VVCAESPPKYYAGGKEDVLQMGRKGQSCSTGADRNKTRTKRSQCGGRTFREYPSEVQSLVVTKNFGEKKLEREKKREN